MALKSGASHAFSTLILTLIGAILVQYLKYVSFFEYLFKINESLAAFFAHSFNLFALVHLPVELFEYILIAFILSFIWGIAFRFIRSD